MNKHDLLKVQTCVLRVNIHCEGCMHKVKKKLQKVEGVYKVSIDLEQGKVVVSGNADPASLIDKLERAGKHAELWGGPQKPAPVFVSGEQFKKFQQMESVSKNGKKGNHEPPQQQKNGNGFAQIPQGKGFRDDKLLSAKDRKSVSFHLPRDVEFDDDDEDEDYSDEDYSDDEEFEDESDEGDFDAHKPPAKAAAGGGHKPSKAAPNSHHKGDKELKTKKGSGMGIDGFFKGMLKKAGRKKGDSDKKSKKEDGGKNGGKKGGFELGDSKKGKTGDGFDGGKQHQQQGSKLNPMKANQKGGGGGWNMNTMGQKGGLPAVAGIPAMNGGRFMAGPGNNPYSQQQQYMAHMMRMNQQRENGLGASHPSAYGRPQPPAMSYGPPPGMVYGPPQAMGYGPPQAMGYGPPQAMVYGPPPATTEQYTHMFSDENTGSCSIM